MAANQRGDAVPTLREVRSDRLLTLRELADKAGIALSTLYMIESGRSSPSFRVIRAISGVLGVEPASVAEFAAAMAEAKAGKAAAA